MIQKFESPLGVSAEFTLREGSTDHLIARQIWQDNEYLRDGFKINPGDIVLDIGGHIGLFSILAVKLGAKFVYIYEPLNSSYELLQKNLRLNNITNVRTYNYAIGKKYKKVYIEHLPERQVTITEEELAGKELSELYDSVYVNIAAAKLVTTPTPGLTSQLVTVIPVNRVFNSLKTIDMLKIDCEGCEYDVFENISSTNLNKVKNIIGEYHCGWDKGEPLLEKLKTLGFEIFNYGYAFPHGVFLARRIHA